VSDEGHVRYEKTDVEPLALLRVGLILMLITIAVVLALLPFFSWLQERKMAQDPPAGPIPRYEPGRRVPEPRLQGRSNAFMEHEGFADAPGLDLAALREEQEALASSYGWIDYQSGIVRIPIDRAMLLVAHRGLPSRLDAGSAPEEPQP
jgi:hypothetical protein